jgi:hypothetical protein
VKTSHSSRGEVHLDVEVKWASDLHVSLMVGFSKFPFLLEFLSMQFSGLVRIKFTPLIPIIPFIGGIQLSFLSVPHIDFSFKIGGLDAMSVAVPGVLDVAQMVTNAIKRNLQELMVYPTHLVIPLTSSTVVKNPSDCTNPTSTTEIDPPPTTTTTDVDDSIDAAAALLSSHIVDQEREREDESRRGKSLRRKWSFPMTSKSSYHRGLHNCNSNNDEVTPTSSNIYDEDDDASLPLSPKSDNHDQMMFLKPCPQGILRVNICRAKDLPRMDHVLSSHGTYSLQSSDPFVVMTVKGSEYCLEEYKTETVKKSLNPEWSRATFEGVCL